MPLLKNAFTINDGCNCNAIRYRDAVPHHTERAAKPYHTPGAEIATASILPHGLVTDVTTVQASVSPYDACEVPAAGKYDSEAGRDWRPAAEVFNSATGSPASGTLSFYRASPGRARWFCRRCGTPLAYSIDDGCILPSWDWPKMLDIWLGTVDRADLEHEYMKPERRLWCEYGVPWILELAKSGAGGVPEHPLTKIDKVVGDEMSRDLEDLRQLEASLRT